MVRNITYYHFLAYGLALVCKPSFKTKPTDGNTWYLLTWPGERWELSNRLMCDINREMGKIKHL